MAGWLKLHRELMDHWVSDEPESLAVFIRLICEANFSDSRKQLNGRPVTIYRGQLVFSYDKFSGRSGVSVAKLRRIIKRLSDDNTISKQSFSKYSVISITNYDSYQGDDKQKASSQQADDRQLATLEEGNNSRREENPSSPPEGERAEAKPNMSCPHMELLDLWADVMYDKRQPNRTLWKPSRKEYKALAARWKELINRPRENGDGVLYSTKEEGIVFWRDVFEYLRKSEFLMREDNTWFDIGWVANATHFNNIVEGKYHGKGQ